MGNKENGFSLLFQFPHDLVDLAAPFMRQRGRRLVHNKKLGLIPETPCDLHQLSIFKVVTVDGVGGLDVFGPDGSKGFLRLPDHRRLVNEAALAKAPLFSEKNIFCNRKPVYGADLLYDHHDRVTSGIQCAAGVIGLPLKEHFTGGDGVQATDHRRDRRFPGAVFSDQAADLTGKNLHVHMVDGQNLSKAFCQTSGFQK